MRLIHITLLVWSYILLSSLYFNYQWQVVEKKSLKEEAQKLYRLAHEIRVVTYPGVCDQQTIEIIGTSCDVGNYMEEAGTRLELQSNTLLKRLER